MNMVDIGVIGLAVMGENLIMNMESKGFSVAVYNRTQEKVTRFLEGRAKGKRIKGAASLKELVSLLAPPRRVLLMVKAGKPVDELIDALLPLLSPGDVILDGGNSHYQDSQRRMELVESKGMYFIGTGISGGEEGALNGPSIMPGGSAKAWPLVKPLLQAISAKVDGQPCCDWVGPGGAGHFVKMVHNGIEYGDMQLIAEAYLIMRERLLMRPDDMSEVFSRWNQGVLDSYLIEITADILAAKDQDGSPLIDSILDAAGQKGTGKWTVDAALDAGVPLTLIAEAVFARALSFEKDLRVEAQRVLGSSGSHPIKDQPPFLNSLQDALYAAKIVSYAQGFALLRAASDAHLWQLDLGSIAMMWRGGCIIRSAFLDCINQAYQENPALLNLLLSPQFAATMKHGQQGLREVVADALLSGIPVPAMASALTYFDGLKTQRGSANLLQAQRDYFGAHTYERVDAPRGQFFHTNWTGEGGTTASTAYNA